MKEMRPQYAPREPSILMANVAGAYVVRLPDKVKARLESHARRAVKQPEEVIREAVMRFLSP